MLLEAWCCHHPTAPSGGEVAPALIAATTAGPPVKVHCHNPACRNPRPIAELVDGQAVVRDHGRCHVVVETTCPKCGARRSFDRA